MSSGPQIHRVVTGHDDRGHAVILVDDIAPNAFSSSTIPGFGAAVPWLTRHPIDHTTDEDPVGEGSPTPTFPRVGETVFRIAEFPPDSAYPEAAKMRSSRRSTARPRPRTARSTPPTSTSGFTAPTRSTTPSCWKARSPFSSTRARRRSRQATSRSSVRRATPGLIARTGRASGVRPHWNGTPLC